MIKLFGLYLLFVMYTAYWIINSWEFLLRDYHHVGMFGVDLFIILRCIVYLAFYSLPFILFYI